MKLLTLNTHSLHGENFSEKAERCLERLLREEVDVIALQEVNQSRTASPATADFRWFCKLPETDEVGLRNDNYALHLARALLRRNMPYFWCWLPVKIGYERYDEGLAFFCRRAIAEIRSFPISRTCDYANWKTRKALCIRQEGSGEWFCNLHTGWWQDSEEPFLDQWKMFCNRMPQAETVWLLGDWNNPSERRNEGYDRISSDGFYDCYILAGQRQGDVTVREAIDGWRGDESAKKGLRVDQIWCNRAVPVRSCRTVWNGLDEAMISDHAGVLAETDFAERENHYEM